MSWFDRLRSPQSVDAASAVPVTYLRLRRGFGAVRVVGEKHNARTLRQVLRRAANWDHVAVALVPEPENRHDRYAVRADVVIEGQHFKAGYVPREVAPGYSSVLSPLAERGIVGWGDGKIRRDEWGNVQVYARLSEDPARLVPPMLDDDTREFVDGLFDMVVTGEEAYQDVLRANAGRQYPIAFGLQSGVVASGKYAGLPAYDVLLGGQRVGQLTRGMSVKHFTVLQSVIDRGRRPYLAGRIEHDHRGYQVILDQPSDERRN